MASTAVEHHESTEGSHGEVAHHSGGHVVNYNPDAPSEAWGWHGSWREFAPKGSRILLWLMTISMFVMMWGEHRSRVEDYWLILIGLYMAYWLLKGEVRIRRERRRRP